MIGTYDLTTSKNLPEKECWHAYGLQPLSPSQFIRVVDRIIAGKNTLLSTNIRQNSRLKSSDSAYSRVSHFHD